MDNQNMNLEPKAGFFSKSYLKHIAGLLGLIALVGGSFFVWSMYFSPEAKYIQKVEKSMAELPGKIEAYKKDMEADTYGGKTPEETLQMFIDALKKGDVELASKYFALDDDLVRDEEWLEALKKTKEAGELQEVADRLSLARPNLEARAYEDDFKFTVKDKDGNYRAYIDMGFNKYSKVWKIESL